MCHDVAPAEERKGSELEVFVVEFDSQAPHYEKGQTGGKRKEIRDFGGPLSVHVIAGHLRNEAHVGRQSASSCLQLSGIAVQPNERPLGCGVGRGTDGHSREAYFYPVSR